MEVFKGRQLVVKLLVCGRDQYTAKGVFDTRGGPETRQYPLPLSQHAQAHTHTHTHILGFNMDSFLTVYTSAYVLAGRSGTDCSRDVTSRDSNRKGSFSLSAELSSSCLLSLWSETSVEGNTLDHYLECY